jgi:hypothetical protein
MKYCIVCGELIKKECLDNTKFGPKHISCSLVGHENKLGLAIRRKVITKPLQKGA